jgi:WD40 repeat protein
MSRCLGASVLAVVWTLIGSASVPAQEAAPKTLKGQTGQVWALAFSPKEAKLAAAGQDRTVMVWDVATGQPIVTFKGHTKWVGAVVFLADGKTIASAGGDCVIRLWDAGTGKEIGQLKGPTKPTASLAITADGKWLASGGYDSIIRLWDLDKKEPVKQFKGHEGRVTSLAFTGDGKKLLSGGVVLAHLQLQGNFYSTGTAEEMRWWDVATGSLIRQFAQRGTTVALSADGKTALGSGLMPDVQVEGGGISIDGFDQVTRFNPDNAEGVFSIRWRGATLALSPNGKLLATGAGNYTHLEDFGTIAHNGINGKNRDNRIRLWDLTVNQEKACLSEKSASVLAFSSDNTLLAAGTHDGPIRVWNVAEVLEGAKAKK